MQRQASDRPSSDRPELEIAAAAQRQRQRMPVGVRTVLVGEDAQWHLTRDVVLQQAVARHRIGPHRPGPIGGIEADRLAGLIEVTARGEPLGLAARGERRAHDHPIREQEVRSHCAAERGTGRGGEVRSVVHAQVAGPGAGPDVDAVEPRCCPDRSICR